MGIPRYEARIFTPLKESEPPIPDPSSQAALEGLKALGFHEVQDAKQSPYFEVRLTASRRSIAERRVQRMCEKLLANPTIQDYHFELITLRQPRQRA